MISTSQKEHLTYTLVGQVGVILGVTLLGFYYLIPGFEKISTNLATANAAVDNYKWVVNNGMDYKSLGSVLSKKPEYAELVKIIQADPKGTETVIKKSGTAPYLEWITRAIGESDNDRKILMTEKAKLNSILPNLSPMSGKIDEEYINLKKYVQYIETNILKRFNFNVMANVGMQGITFGNATNKLPNNVGMFEFRFDFEGNNGDILDFISFVNSTGNPEILTNTGNLAGTGNFIISDTAPGIMGNPLITITNFALQNPLDPNNRTGENSGRVSIAFYVRGGSKDDINYLKENIKSRKAALEKEINDRIKECQNNAVLCASYAKKLDAFALKYKEFSRSSVTVAGTTPSDDIYNLAGQASVVQSLESEFDNILPKKK